jgi:hypothetical protein
MNPLLCNAIPQVVPLLSRDPVLLVRKYQCWKLQGFSVVDSSFTTSIILMHTCINFLLEIPIVTYNQLAMALYLQQFVSMPKNKNKSEQE